MCQSVCKRACKQLSDAVLGCHCDSLRAEATKRGGGGGKAAKGGDEPTGTSGLETGGEIGVPVPSIHVADNALCETCTLSDALCGVAVSLNFQYCTFPSCGPNAIIFTEEAQCSGSISAGTWCQSPCTVHAISLISLTLVLSQYYLQVATIAPRH